MTELHPYVRGLADALRPKYGDKAVPLAQVHSDYIDYRAVPDGHPDPEAHRLASRARFIEEIMAILDEDKSHDAE